ncbi:hypothetical protein P7K49_022263, partial [Saguinus oedipus]
RLSSLCFAPSPELNLEEGGWQQNEEGETVPALEEPVCPLVRRKDMSQNLESQQNKGQITYLPSNVEMKTPNHKEWQ